jgi:uncharacterized protein
MITNHPWGHPRRFNSYTEYFKNRFGGRVQKLAIDAGFTCPNRDNTIGIGGCTYCDNNAFNPSYCKPEKSISRQIEEGIEFHRLRYRRATRFLAYFQAYSNTYASLETLHRKYEEALAFPGVIGLVIGTRPDCVNGEILDFLSRLSERVYIIVEYGIESCYDRTLVRIKRGHNFEKTRWALEESHKRNILCGGHMIIGLPGESRTEILNEAEILSELPLHTIKFHQLQIIKGTAMALEFKRNPGSFEIPEMEDYLVLMKEFVERLNPAFVIERIAGEVPPAYSVNQPWNIRYDKVLQRFEDILNRYDTWQGKLYNTPK